jgi:hypothetical protein
LCSANGQSRPPFRFVPDSLSDKQKPAETWAVIAGTVFREPGFALPGAEVTLEPEQPGGKNNKVKRQQAISNSRGEFAFRVPAVALRYTVSVRARGYQAEEKTAEIQGEQRVDVYFSLKPDTSKP